MLQPKRVKYRRCHGQSYEGLSKGGNGVLYGNYGLQATSGAFVSNRQIESCRVVLSRYTKKGGKVIIRIFPQLGKTKKPAEVRMGTGKGSIDSWVCPVKVNRILFEIVGVDDTTAIEALHQCSYKLSCRSRVVKKGQEDR
jgi:large subunit ribosomal protein L16